MIEALDDPTLKSFAYFGSLPSSFDSLDNRDGKGLDAWTTVTLVLLITLAALAILIFNPGLMEGLTILTGVVNVHGNTTWSFGPKSCLTGENIGIVPKAS
jgi:hypothetical protein